MEDRLERYFEKLKDGRNFALFDGNMTLYIHLSALICRTRRKLKIRKRTRRSFPYNE